MYTKVLKPFAEKGARLIAKLDRLMDTMDKYTGISTKQRAKMECDLEKVKEAFEEKR